MKKSILASILAVIAITTQSHAKELEKIYFEDYREKITEAITQGLEKRTIQIDEPVTLLTGFIFESESGQLENALSCVITESMDPMIMLASSNGTIYLLSLKTILPEIDVRN